MNPITENTNNTPIPPVTPENTSQLAQNKIPTEMLASYYIPPEFEPLTQDFSYMGFDQSQAMFPQMNQYYQYQAPYYEFYQDQVTPYALEFPRATTYSNEEAILEAFPHLEGLNDSEFSIESVAPNAHFYVLRSSNDDNIHKAIKYQKWTSTASGKNVLKKAWQEFEDAGVKPEIYFLFTVVNSNQFLGVAKMTSNVNDEDSFKYWWEPCKWFGSFQIKWLFIKDIHYSYFDHIREGDHSTSIVNLRDGTKISADTGKDILNLFKHHPAELTIFDSFEYMDRREDNLRVQRDNDSSFQKLFNECCEAYLNGQEVFYSQRKQPYHKSGGRKYPTNGNSRNNNGYHQKTLYYKKNEDKQGYKHHHGSPSTDNSDPKDENEKQTRKYGGSNYKRRHYNSNYGGERIENGYYEQGNNFTVYKQLNYEGGENGYQQRKNFNGGNRKYGARKYDQAPAQDIVGN